MERIDQMLDEWIHNSIIRARLRKLIVAAIHEQMATNKKYKYITVLDFEVGKVFQYDIHGVVDKNEQEITQSEQMEEYLTIQGHNLSNCEWMVHKDNEIITN